MTVVNNREELKQFCLRKLGAPVININVADDQLEDRIDDSLQYFNEWHIDGVEKLFLKYKPTTSTIALASAIPIDTFHKGDSILGQTSGVSAIVYSIAADGLSLQVWQTGSTVNSDARFTPGETIQTSTNHQAVINTDPTLTTYGDFDNRYIPIPDHVISIERVFPVSASQSANFLFDPVYYTAYDLIWSFSGMDLISYDVMKTRINFINELLVGKKPIRFNRYTNQLHIDIDWRRAMNPDSWFMIECHRTLDPLDYSKIYNDFFLKEYTAALFKIQWGHNLSKFNGIQLPGGVTLDGQRILAEGKEEKLALEEQMKNGRFSSPLGFKLG